MDQVTKAAPILERFRLNGKVALVTERGRASAGPTRTPWARRAPRWPWSTSPPIP